MNMSDFQNFLDESLSRVKFSGFGKPEARIPEYDIDKEIRELIVRERKMQKLTQKQLAVQTGLSQANISNIEKGVNRPTIDSLKKIADALGKRLVIEFEDREDLI
jgi:ribosome-binding protein aMBF1 (putative translation factor)